MVFGTKLEDTAITEKLMIAYIPETMDTHSANSVRLKAGINWLGTVTAREGLNKAIEARNGL